MNFKPDKYEAIVIRFYKFAGKSPEAIKALIGRFLIQRQNEY